MPDATAAADPRLDVLKLVSDDIDSCIRKAESNETAMRASRDTLQALLSWTATYKKDLEAGLDDGTIPRAAEPYVMACFKDINGHIDKVRSRVHDGIIRADVPGYVKGLQKARQIAAGRASMVAKRNEAHAARLAREAAEDAEWRAGKVQAPATPEDPPEVDVTPPSDQPQDDGQREPTDESPKPEPEGLEESKPKCAHCDDEILVDTGSEHCAPCIVHRSKYKKLPSAKALAKRSKQG